MKISELKKFVTCYEKSDHLGKMVVFIMTITISNLFVAVSVLVSVYRH